MNPQSPLERVPENPPVPAIYKLIERQASVEEIAQRLYTDFYSPDRDSERVYLAIDDLIFGGPEGYAVLETLSEGTDELGSIIKKILDTEPEGPELERELGINRFTNILDSGSISSEEDYYRRAYTYAKGKGYTHKTFEQCLQDLQHLKIRGITPVGVSKEVSVEVFTNISTFGVDEPTYLELLGVREILRLRSMQSPKFLLLGSLGTNSSREFRAYANKINTRIQPFVIDISDYSIDALSRDPINTGTLAQADARKLPFADGSMDHIYTNNLVRFLGKEKGKTNITEDVKDLLESAFRVLKKNGSLVMNEHSPKADGESDDTDFAGALFDLAKDAGFVLEEFKRETHCFLARKEVGTATIDANGFPHYGDAYLSRHLNISPLGIRLIKP